MGFLKLTMGRYMGFVELTMGSHMGFVKLTMGTYLPTYLGLNGPSPPPTNIRLLTKVVQTSVVG
jgi:hypothetical protein